METDGFGEKNGERGPRRRRRSVRHLRTRVCSPEFGVTTLEVSGGRRSHRRKPCAECPWRVDSPVGAFPPDAYRASAPTSYDAALSAFACHMSGAGKPSTCAGFLLRHAEHNLLARLSAFEGPLRVSDGGTEVYPSYREMAIANGVPPDDPVLAPVRANGEEWNRETRRFGPVDPEGD